MMIAMMDGGVMTGMMTIMMGCLCGGGHHDECKRGRAEKSYHWENSVQ
jgi:hypothetical protein